MKKFIWVAIVVLVVILAGVFYRKEISHNKDSYSDSFKPTFDWNNPGYAQGEVVRVEANGIVFKSAGKEYKATVGPDTVLTKETPSATGLNMVTVKLSDIKPKNKVVVYGKTTSDTSYSADKILIVP